MLHILSEHGTTLARIEAKLDDKASVASVQAVDATVVALRDDVVALKTERKVRDTFTASRMAVASIFAVLVAGGIGAVIGTFH